jgi:hypothetical protein
MTQKGECNMEEVKSKENCIKDNNLTEEEIQNIKIHKIKKLEKIDQISKKRYATIKTISYCGEIILIYLSAKFLKGINVSESFTQNIDNIAVPLTSILGGLKINIDLKRGMKKLKREALIKTKNIKNDEYQEYNDNEILSKIEEIRYMVKSDFNNKLIMDRLWTLLIKLYFLSKKLKDNTVESLEDLPDNMANLFDGPYDDGEYDDDEYDDDEYDDKDIEKQNENVNENNTNQENNSLLKETVKKLKEALKRKQEQDKNYNHGENVISFEEVMKRK